MSQILIASTNAGKIREIAKMMGDWNLGGIEVCSLKDYPREDPDEPYDDFLKNAIHKAEYYGKAAQLVTLSDDSGLCVEALDGFPGVKTKDFVLECGGLPQAFLALEKKLAGAPNRRARFHTAIAVYFPATGLWITEEREGRAGRISFPPRGEVGFGFDPIFIPEGFDRTMAELGPSVKNRISPRSEALATVFEKLRRLWVSG